MTGEPIRTRQPFLPPWLHLPSSFVSVWPLGLPTKSPCSSRPHSDSSSIKPCPQDVPFPKGFCPGRRRGERCILSCVAAACTPPCGSRGATGLPTPHLTRSVAPATLVESNSFWCQTSDLCFGRFGLGWPTVLPSSTRIESWRASPSIIVLAGTHPAHLCPAPRQPAWHL